MPTRRAVAGAYATRVLLPLVLGPLVGQALVWLVENPFSARGHATGYLVVACLAGWAAACWGTVVLARRFREDRRESRPNGARGWHVTAVVVLVAAWLPVLVLLVFGLGMALGVAGLRT